MRIPPPRDRLAVEETDGEGPLGVVVGTWSWCVQIMDTIETNGFFPLHTREETRADAKQTGRGWSGPKRRMAAELCSVFAELCSFLFGKISPMFSIRAWCEDCLNKLLCSHRAAAKCFCRDA